MQKLYYVIFTTLVTLVIVSQYAASLKKNPFQVIGVRPDASFEEIKKAYRELARTLHPDKARPGDHDASNRFAEINRAYSILKDPEKRRRYGPNLSQRTYRRRHYQSAQVYPQVTSSDTISSILLIVLFAVGGSLLFYQNPSNYMPNYSNREDANFPTSENYPPPQREQIPQVDDDDLKIVELEAETYNSVLRLFRPGCMSIILLADRESKEVLLPKFMKAVWPHRRNRTLTFGYLCLDKNLSWFESLLQQVVGLDDFTVNKNKCVGTVLSLNGFKKYFRMYHANQAEDRTGDSIFGEDNETQDDASYEVLDSQETSTIGIPVENLLDRFPIWLDKMFDGMTRRYFIDSWPVEMV